MTTIGDDAIAEPQSAYHGTPKANIKTILREGLRPDSWMALSWEEARHHGGPEAVVLHIDLSQLEGTWPRDEDGSLHWQAHTNTQAIPPSALEVQPDHE